MYSYFIRHSIDIEMLEEFGDNKRNKENNVAVSICFGTQRKQMMTMIGNIFSVCARP